LNHAHIGVLFALTVFANVVILGFIWRVVGGLLAVHPALSPLGQAMLYLY